jgi:hypothetical protein
MSLYLTVTVVLAMVCLLATGIAHAGRVKEWKPFLLETTGLAAFALFLHWLFGFPIPGPALTAKGAQDDFTIASVLFACMILGMLAQGFYQHYTLPSSMRVRKPLDFGLLIAPLCASPIVFIPLMVALQNSNIDLRALTVPRMMIFFVAFQNGFFWKEHFDRQRRDAKVGRS